MRHALLVLALLPLAACGGLSDTPAAKEALPELATLAAPHLQELAEREGVQLDETRGVCFDIPTDEVEDLLPEELPVSVVAVLCVAPELKTPDD